MLIHVEHKANRSAVLQSPAFFLTSSSGRFHGFAESSTSLEAQGFVFPWLTTEIGVGEGASK